MKCGTHKQNSGGGIQTKIRATNALRSVKTRASETKQQTLAANHRNTFIADLQFVRDDLE